MSAQSNPDWKFCEAAASDAFQHRTLASIQLLLKELEERGVTIDPVTGKVTITPKPGTVTER